jgi:3-deoxy-7-phosphoheptulonate synthase
LLPFAPQGAEDETMHEAQATMGADADILPTPAALRAAIPATEEALDTVRAGRRALRDLIHGRDPGRLAVIVGPCSIHDPEAALDYAERLQRVAAPLASELVVLMRTFVEKPRTALGWRGLLHDPGLDGSCDVARGLAISRALLDAIGARGVACAAEILDPFTSGYLDDLLVWGGIGARTSESPIHRQLASGLPFPVGFKNGTSGDIDAACNGVRAAARPHRSLGVDRDGACRVQHTPGNPDRHVVLRGGAAGTNYDALHIAATARRLADENLARPVMVDCSHANSQQDSTRQSVVFRDVLGALRRGRPELLGLMLESHLEAGRQPIGADRPLRYGVSVTDACISWNETADLLCEAAEAVKLSR